MYLYSIIYDSIRIYLYTLNIYIINREAASPSRTHTPTKSFKQISGRRRKAQNVGAEHMKRS